MMRLSPYQMLVVAGLIWFFFFRNKSPSPMFIGDGGNGAGYNSIVNGEGYP